MDDALEAAFGAAAAVQDVADAVEVAGEIVEFHGQIGNIQDSLTDNLQETVGNTLDNQHEAIRQNAEASRDAYENKEISLEEHQANIDKNAERLRQLDAGTNEMVEAATDATQISMVGEAIVTAGQSLAKATGLGVVGEMLLPDQFSE